MTDAERTTDERFRREFPGATDVFDFIEPDSSASIFSIGSETWPGLSKLAEESGELIQVIGKIIGAYPSVDHWDGTNLRVRLEEELADLSAAIVFVKQHCGLDELAIEKRTALKLQTFDRWHSEQTHA